MKKVNRIRQQSAVLVLVLVAALGQMFFPETTHEALLWVALCFVSLIEFLIAVAGLCLLLFVFFVGLSYYSNEPLRPRIREHIRSGLKEIKAAWW